MRTEGGASPELNRAVFEATGAYDCSRSLRRAAGILFEPRELVCAISAERERSGRRADPPSTLVRRMADLSANCGCYRRA
jgi:hypothetical protein